MRDNQNVRGGHSMGGRTFDQFQSRQKAKKQAKPKNQADDEAKRNTEPDESHKEN
jgi:hypothetical protein